MPDYDLVVIGSGFAGSTATLSFLEAAEKAGQAGRVALIEAGKRGTWPGGSRWTRPFLRLDRDNTILSDRAESVEQNLSDLDYWRTLEDEVPDTVKFMEDHGVKLIHHDEENAALDFEEQHFAHPTGGGKEIADNYLILIAKYETADIFYGHEANELILDDEGRIGGVVVREPDGGQRNITAGTVVLACGGFEGNAEMLTQHIGEDADGLPIIVPGIKYNRGVGLLINHYQPECAETFFNTVSTKILHRSYFHNDFIFVRPAVATEYLDSTSRGRPIARTTL